MTYKSEHQFTDLNNMKITFFREIASLPNWFVRVPGVVLMSLTLQTTGKNLLGKCFKRGEWRPLGILEMIYLLCGNILFVPFPERVDRCNANVNQESCFKGPEDQAKTSVTGPAVCVVTGVVSALKGVTPSRTQSESKHLQPLPWHTCLVT